MLQRSVQRSLLASAVRLTFGRLAKLPKVDVLYVCTLARSQLELMRIRAWNLARLPLLSHLELAQNVFMFVGVDSSLTM